MVRMIKGCLLAFAAASLFGCGATVGDACTTPDECGDGLCLNRDFTPGGYCSQQCVIADADSCPSGTVCVRNAAGPDLSACFLRCDTDEDCRAGYVCRQGEDWPDRICIGPEGI